MKLHVKLTLSVLSGLVVIVLIAQILQFSIANHILTSRSHHTLDIIQEMAEQFVKNIFRSMERAVSGSLERGEMEKFTKLLEEQRNVEGLVEFSLYNKEGVVTHSSDPSFIKKSLSQDLGKRLLTNPEQYFRHSNQIIEIYQPQIVNADCIRCHMTWKKEEICGIIAMRYATKALATAKQHTEETRQATRTAFITNSLFSLVGIVAVFMALMAWSTAKFIKHPLNRVIHGLRDIAEGEGDLTKRLDIDSSDELGTLARLFNLFSEKLQQMVQQVQLSGIQITSSSTELAATAKEQEHLVQAQVQSTDKVLKSVEEISTVNKNLVQTIREVTSTEQADPSAKDATNLARMAEAMHFMEEASRSISERLETINEKAGNITEMVTTITRVADQTNLLSLNAAIEAEKAGEYGHGFTVVAREIRRLADQTAIATLDIEKMVKEMQAAVGSGVEEVNTFNVEVRKSADDVKRISMKLYQIISQVHALSPRFEDVNRSMVHLNEETQETGDSLHETYAAIEQLNEAARQLRDQVTRFKVS